MSTEIGPMAVIARYHREVERRFPERYSQRRLPSTRMQKDLDTVREFLAWCDERGVEHPLIFIEVYFAHVYAVTKGRVWPSFKELRAENMLPLYEQMLEGILENNRLKSAPERDYYLTLAMNQHVNEIVRRDYVLSGKTDLCYSQPGISGSYHPKSPWCTRCPQAAECITRLNKREGFDVSALRVGNHDALPSKIRLLVIG